jgi:hypothetical protein
MEFGLLWYDSDPQRALEEKIEQAARRYQQKFGRPPNLCYVHPKAVASRPDPGRAMDCPLENPKTTIRVIPAPNILIHHLWLGEGSAIAGLR